MQSPRKPDLLTPLVNDIDRLRREWGIKGVSITVVNQDPGDDFNDWKTEFLGLGVRDGEGNPVDEHTLFSIASNSKLFTALAVGLVIHQQSLATEEHGVALDWDTKVKDVVPDWGLMDPVASENANLIDLLAHRTGLPNHVMFEEHDPNTTKATIISRLRHLRPSTEFRHGFQYCNAGYLVASTIPEQVYGIPFTRYVTAHIVRPLCMDDTTYDPGEAIRSGRRVDGFVRGRSDLEACSKVGKDESTECRDAHVNVGWYTTSKETMAGQGGVITSAKDLATWLKFLLLDGRSPITNEQVIPSHILAAATTPYVTLHEPEPLYLPHIGAKTYGLGQILYNYRGYEIVEHFGSVPGQRSRILRVPEKRLGLAIMVNDEVAWTYTEVVQYMILDRLLGLDPIDWKARLREELVNELAPAVRPVPCLKVPLDCRRLEKIQGTYYDKAYGKIVVCAVPATMPDGFRVTQSLAAVHEDTLASNPFTIDSSKDNPRPTYIARLPKHWSNYLLFKHVDGSTFIVTQNSWFPEYDVPATTVCAPFRASFTEDGMGWSGNVWGSWPEVDGSSRLTGDIKVDAEVWFDKIEEL